MEIESKNRVASSDFSESTGPDDVAGRPELLAEPIGGGSTMDVIASVALILERSLNARRRSADASREAADRSQEAAENAQVKSMREEAHDTFKQAIVSCSLSIAASAVQTVAAGVQLRGADLQTRAADYTGKTGDWMMREGARAEKWGGCLNAGGKTFESLSGGANGVIGAEIKHDAVDAKEHENTAHRYARDVQRLTDAERELGELANKTLARLEEILQAQHQTKLALIQRA